MLLRTAALRLGALRSASRPWGAVAASAAGWENSTSNNNNNARSLLPLSTWPPAAHHPFSTTPAAASSSRGRHARRGGAGSKNTHPPPPTAASTALAPQEAPAPTNLPQPPPRPTSISGDGSPASALELASALAHPALIVTRDVEWANILVGFEQANKYAVRDENGAVVALLFEETTNLASAVGRQVLRARRSFTATLTTPEGRLLLRMKRPLYLINSKTLVEDAAGRVVGEVVQEWAPLRRRYALFMRDGGAGNDGEHDGADHRVQTLAVDAPFLAWEFPLTGPDGSTRALLDRNFQGFGKELWTDAGRYALHFGFEGAEARAMAAGVATATIAAAHPGAGVAAAETAARKDAASAVLPAGGALVPTATGGQLVVRDPLSSLGERALALALAVAVDFDYFSRHSSGGGVGGMWPLFLPIPSPPVPAPPPVVAGGAAGEGAGAAGAGPEPTGSDSPDAEPLERDLGEDAWGQGGGGESGGQGDGWGNDEDGGGGGGGGDSGWSWDDAGGADAAEEGGSALGGLWDVARGLFSDD